jgi:Protein of unknown function (DUF2637)
MIAPRRFSDLTTFGKTLIVGVAILTLGIAAVAFATSYGALRAWVETTGLYAESGRYAELLNTAWPLLFDAAFIVAQLAAILAGILRGSRLLPGLMMLIAAGTTIWFNWQHAGADPGRRLAATIPPVLMILAFELDIAIVRWVLAALGRPLEAPGAYSPAGPSTALWRAPDGSYGAVPGMVPAPGPWPQMPTWAPAPSGQTGHGNGEAAIRPRVEQYLTQLGPDELARMTKGELADTMAAHGVEVSVRYAGQILDEYRVGLPARRGSEDRRRGGR